MRKLVMGAVFTLAFGIVGPAHAGWEEGVRAYRSGNFSAAAYEFQAVVERRPDFAGGHFMLGQALARLERSQEALSAFRQAYDLDPNSVQFQLALADAYLAAERYSEAGRLYDRIDASSLPSSVQAVFRQNQAIAMEKSGRSDDALTATGAAAKVQQDDAGYENLLQLGQAQLDAGAYADALNSLEQASALRAGGWPVLYYMSQAQTGLGEYAAAAATLRDLLQSDLSPEDEFRVYKQIGTVQEKLGNYAEARAAYARAGDQTSVARVDENARIAAENRKIEAHNREIEAMEAEADALEEQLNELEEGRGGRLY